MDANAPSRTARLAAIAGLCLAAHCWARPGGGGSAAIFSLDPASPSDLGLGGGALYRDDPVTDGILTLLFAPGAIGLPLGADLDGVSGGRDSGIPAILAAIGVLPNPLDNPDVIYQYSVGRGAVDGVTGPVPIPFDAPALMTQRADYAVQFTDVPPHPQSDIFDNRALVGRWNFPMVLESGPIGLELLGAGVPVEMQDNLDAFTSEGAIGGDPDTDGNGQLDVGRRLYWSVSAPGSGLAPGVIYTVLGDNTSSPIPMPFALSGELGLGLDDDIDAISIWDTGPGGTPDGIFGPGDGIVFSLSPGSALLGGAGFIIPGDPGAVPIDAAGIFLAVPGAGIITGLPGGYFCQSPGSDLDAILAIDPRNYNPPVPCGPGTAIARLVAPGEALRADPALRELTLDPADPLMACNELCITVNNLDRIVPGFITSYTLVATVEDPSIAAITNAGSVWCPCGCGGSGPPCIGPSGPGSGATVSAVSLCCGALGGQDVCLADLRVCGVSPGTTRILISGSGGGPFGPVEFAPTEVIIRVVGIGLPPPCYANCDGSTIAPAVNVLDFACFLNRFATGDPWANCDGSAIPPVINVLDFACFLNMFAAGCS